MFATPALLLLRHGKSDWEADYGGDADRPLKGRGRKAARLMGRLLSSTEQQPDFAITSTAYRATETLELAKRAGDWSCPTVANHALYLQSAPELIRTLSGSIPDSARLALAVGHEPTWSDLVELLTGASVTMPTAAACRIELDISTWAELRPGVGRLQWLLPPRLLLAAGLKPPKP